MVTSLRSYPPSRCRFPVWPQESHFKLVLSPLLWPEVPLILFLLVKLSAHEYRRRGRPAAARALSVPGLCGWFVFDPIWVLYLSRWWCQCSLVSLRTQWRMFQGKVCKKLLCLFNHRHFGIFSKRYLKGDGVAVEPTRGQKSDNVLEKERYSEMRIMETALDFYGAIIWLKKVLSSGL